MRVDIIVTARKNAHNNILPDRKTMLLDGEQHGFVVCISGVVKN